MGTLLDHVAPWRSTYKVHLLTDCEVTYLLASGGHNVGIVSEPGRDNRFFHVMTSEASDHYLDPEAFLATAPRQVGSWWPEWTNWLKARSGAAVAPPMLGAEGYPPLCDAPGAYVLQE